MNILVFSDNKKVKNCFSEIEAGSDYTVEYMPCSDLKKCAKKAAPGSLVYYDPSGSTQEEQVKIIRYLSRLNGYYYGILDPRSSIEDIASLFHNGASDYVGMALFKKGLSLKRQKKLSEFIRAGETAVAEETASAAAYNYRLSGPGWDNVKDGKEYTFCIMFIEIDDYSSIRKKFGVENFKTLTDRFHDHLEWDLSPCGGRVWMWSDYGGLVLFPFDGRECSPIMKCFRLMLNRKLINIEYFDIDFFLSYRIALLLGNTVYRSRGQTGTIVSDSVNTIFHIGHKFAEKGNFYLTSELAEYIPAGLENYFVHEGEFEGRDIMRMRLPL